MFVCKIFLEILGNSWGPEPLLSSLRSFKHWVLWVTNLSLILTDYLAGILNPNWGNQEIAEEWRRYIEQRPGAGEWILDAHNPLAWNLCSSFSNVAYVEVQHRPKKTPSQKYVRRFDFSRKYQGWDFSSADSQADSPQIRFHRAAFKTGQEPKPREELFLIQTRGFVGDRQA